MDLEELERSYTNAVAKPVAICIINPGNPTGQVLSKDNIRKILQFAYYRHLFVLADEVYQDNIYAEGSAFYSFRSVLMEQDFKNELELASFHSTSKGYMGECGFRSGYMEVNNLDADVKVQLTKVSFESQNQLLTTPKAHLISVVPTSCRSGRHGRRRQPATTRLGELRTVPGLSSF